MEVQPPRGSSYQVGHLPRFAAELSDGIASTMPRLLIKSTCVRGAHAPQAGRMVVLPNATSVNVVHTSGRRQRKMP